MNSNKPEARASTSFAIPSSPKKTKTLLAGLTLGPLEFDLYLLGKARSGGNVDDDLILIFVGREQRDLQYLNDRWRDQTGGSLTSITGWTANKNLQYALKICTSNNRDTPTKPVDDSRVPPRRSSHDPRGW